MQIHYYVFELEVQLIQHQIKRAPGANSGSKRIFPLWLYYSRKMGIFQDL